MPGKAKSKRFASDAQEAEWWNAQERRLADEFEEAIAGGCACPANLVITGESGLIKVRLSTKDIALLRRLAKARELRCHDYLKSLLHAALRKSGEPGKFAAP